MRTTRNQSQGRTREESVGRGAYVDGNTVRKFSVVQMPKQPQQQPARDSRVQPGRQKRPGRDSQSRRQQRTTVRQGVQEKPFGFGYVVVLAVCAAVTLWVCTGYLKMQAENTRKVKNIAALEKQLTELKTENDDEYNRLVGSVDLNQIRETAIEELGMVYANADQVVLYDGKSNDYVRQYREIPQEESSILDGLLGSK